jgi:hypothetical protein
MFTTTYYMNRNISIYSPTDEIELKKLIKDLDNDNGDWYIKIENIVNFDIQYGKDILQMLERDVISRKGMKRYNTYIDTIISKIIDKAISGVKFNKEDSEKLLNVLKFLVKDVYTNKYLIFTKATIDKTKKEIKRLTKK